jgi:hypothetical protein
MLARTITLELLRHGPAQNQLLSPLTAYLALSGNHAAETVHVGFEHVQMLRKMRGLRYQDGRAAEAGAVEEASAEVSRLLGGVRSLTAEMGVAPRGQGEALHLRLVISASELAMLPFELARSPAGFPGAGQWLSLQTATPIALTREVRRVTAGTVRWPERPRVLVVAASPPGVASVPLRAHLLALRAAFDPWISRAGADHIGHHVTVIPRATLAAVREACARAAGDGVPYTHVHVLAHGVPDAAALDGAQGYGLAFHAAENADKMDVVTGTRLAAALRCHPAGAASAEELAAPAVVTVASCDSANVGSVIGTGASLAHELHEAGVPLVLASQFPLSVRGSVIMARVVYDRLLRGEDPRALVHDLRQALHVGCPDTHDWASVVVYAAFPADLDAQVKRARTTRALLAVNAALSRRDDEERSRPGGSDETRDALRGAMKALHATLPAADDPVPPGERTRVLGVLAASAKRVAHAFYGEPLWPILSAPSAAALDAAAFRDAALPADVAAQAEARRLLEDARGHYLQIFRAGVGEAWPLVQYLSLSAALHPVDRDLPSRDRLSTQRVYAGFWTTAHVTAEDNLKSRVGRERVWAHAALVELYVLAQLLPGDHWARKEAEDRAHHHLDAVLDDGVPLDGYSLRRQLLRFTAWWWKGRDALTRLPAELSARMADRGIGHLHVEEG